MSEDNVAFYLRFGFISEMFYDDDQMPFQILSIPGWQNYNVVFYFNPSSKTVFSLFSLYPLASSSFQLFSGDNGDLNLPVSLCDEWRELVFFSNDLVCPSLNVFQKNSHVRLSFTVRWKMVTVLFLINWSLLQVPFSPWFTIGFNLNILLFSGYPLLPFHALRLKKVFITLFLL